MTDAGQFEAFVDEYQDLVFGTAVRLLGNPVEAEDVSQTVFLRAFERFADLGPDPARAGWLKTVATNLCLNHLTRYRARWQFFSELDAPDARDGRAFVDTLTSPVLSPDEVRHGRDRDLALERALRALPDHQRVPLVLYHFEERSYQDIATTLGVSLGKIKTDIHRGREALRQALAGAPR
jgi:RNA polymerase sigma-70 factor (ECF subfamily)